MAFLDQDSFRLYYEDTGSNAPTVLFLHGAGGNHLSWWQQVPVFPRNTAASPSTSAASVSHPT